MQALLREWWRTDQALVHAYNTFEVKQARLFTCEVTCEASKKRLARKVRRPFGTLMSKYEPHVRRGCNAALCLYPVFDTSDQAQKNEWQMIAQETAQAASRSTGQDGDEVNSGLS
jgi:hypothetical protein